MLSKNDIHCCDRKFRVACAQSFALWQQATIEFTSYDHSVVACSRHIYVWWWITHSTQHHRRGCNTTNYCPTSSNANPRQLSLLVQINKGLYFRSQRLAARFASNIAKVLVKALLNKIIKFNIEENQVGKNSQGHISSVFSLKIHLKLTKTLFDRRICNHVSCSQLFGLFPLGLCQRQPRNRQIHRQVCWKRYRISGVVGKERNIGFVGFLGNAKMVSEVSKMIVLWNVATKSRLKASLAESFALHFSGRAAARQSLYTSRPWIATLKLPFWSHSVFFDSHVILICEQQLSQLTLFTDQTNPTSFRIFPTLVTLCLFA